MTCNRPYAPLLKVLQGLITGLQITFPLVDKRANDALVKGLAFLLEHCSFRADGIASKIGQRHLDLLGIIRVVARAKIVIPGKINHIALRPTLPKALEALYSPLIDKHAEGRRHIVVFVEGHGAHHDMMYIHAGDVSYYRWEIVELSDDSEVFRHWICSPSSI